MNTKRTILILTDWFLPGYLAGGPIQSIATLTEQLGKDIDFKIITGDRDFKSITPYSEVRINEWTEFNKRKVFYMGQDRLHEGYMLDLIKATPHDAIYINSLFSKFFAIDIMKWRKQGKIKSEIVIAPRGMLGDGALAIKPLKKQLFLRYAKAFGYFKNLKWQSTSAQETAEIKKRISSKVIITQLPNLPNSAGQPRPLEKRNGILNICFISRISEKKNLDFAIDVLKEIKNQQIKFDIYGPIEDELYWNTCKENATHLSENVHLQYCGSLKPEQVGKILSNYHALFLPTQNENYGHIIVETLQYGRLVILSDQTPWRGLEAKKVGFDIALSNKAKFVEAVQWLAELEQPEFDAMSQNCQLYVQAKLNVAQIKQDYLKLFGA